MPATWYTCLSRRKQSSSSKRLPPPHLSKRLRPPHLSDSSRIAILSNPRAGDRRNPDRRRTRCQGINGSLKRVGDRGRGRQGDDGCLSLDEGGAGRVSHPSRSLFRWSCAALASDDSAHGLGHVRTRGSYGVGDRTTMQKQEVDEEIAVTYSSSTSFVVRDRSVTSSSP